MSTTVKFNNTSLQNVNRVVQKAGHDSMPERELNILPLARGDGGVFVSDHFKSKAIQVQGVIKATSKADLESEIDNFKELLSGTNENLDIEYAGGTRRYVAYARTIDIERDYFHLNFAPYFVEFIVPEGIGKDTSVTAALDAVSADPTYTGSVTFAGSAEPKPTITLTFGSGWTNAYGIKFENTDREEECIINYDTGFSDGDELEIDCEEKTVKLNDTEIEFYRVFPSFAIGANNIEITAGDIIDQEFDSTGGTASTSNPIRASSWVAMSFTVPHSDDTYQGISLRFMKAAAVGDDLSVYIETDSNGEPSGTPVANASFTIAEADIDTSVGWVSANSTNRFSLSANTRYWIVCKAVDATGDEYRWEHQSDSAATYGRGHGATSIDSGSTWTGRAGRDYGFRLLFGGKPDSPGGTLTLDVDYYKRYL